MIRAASICKLSLRLCLCAAGRGSSAAVTVRIPLLVAVGEFCVASFSFDGDANPPAGEEELNSSYDKASLSARGDKVGT